MDTTRVAHCMDFMRQKDMDEAIYIYIQCPPELLAPFSKNEQNEMRKNNFIVYPHDLSFKIFTKI